MSLLNTEAFNRYFKEVRVKAKPTLTKLTNKTVEYHICKKTTLQNKIHYSLKEDNTI